MERYRRIDVNDQQNSGGSGSQDPRRNRAKILASAQHYLNQYQ